MKNYVYIYYNDEDMGGESMEEVTKAWMSWFKELGDKVVDAGNPFAGGGKAVSKAGVMDVKQQPATGYSIVKANSKDEAVEWAQTCPVLQAKGGAVCVYETMPM